MGRVGLQPPTLHSNLLNDLTKTLQQYLKDIIHLHTSLGQEVLIRGQFCAMKVLIAFKDLRFQDLLVDDGWDGMDGMDGWMDGLMMD